MISRFAVKTAKTSFYIITATTAIASLSLNPNYLNDSSFISYHIRSALNGVVRSSRALGTITLNVVDYKYSLRSLSVGSDDYRRILGEVHLRSAKRTLKLCETNGGFYVKAGQLIAAMRQVPKEYSSTLSSLQDQAVPCEFKAIKQVLISNLGPDFADIFLSLDEEPIAAASIAQVHRALLKDNQEVAVKVQYPGIERQMKLDLATVSFLSESVTWFFPEYRFNWMTSEFSKAIALELDFIQEARNSERTAKNFENNPLIRVPGVFWEFTTSQVLTMEFCRGKRVDDLEYLKEMKINPTKVAKALVEVFSEMIFVHGFLHGDLHPGNILVSPEGQNRFSLVLLDHGTYKELDEDFRVSYCELWKALILLDSNKIQKIGEQFGVEKYSRYFPLIFTGRTIDSKAALGSGMSDEEKRNLKKDITSLRMEDVSSFMESLPSDFLAVLRADGLLKSLISKFGFSQRERLLCYAKYAVQGLSGNVNGESDVVVNVAASKLRSSMSYLQLRLVLEVVKLVSWSEDCRRWLIRRFKLLVNSADCIMANVLYPSSTTTS